MRKIILASGSPRRKKLLQQIALSFEVHVSSANESYEPHLTPEQIVQQLAERKAKDVAPDHQNALIIGADTIVVFEDKILEKPATNKEAEEMLLCLSSNTHQVLTGVFLCKVDEANNISEQTTFVEKTDVIFGELDPSLVEQYVASGSPMDKAGGYGIQDDLGAIFIKRIEGDYYNVVGFPLHRFYTAMDAFAPECLPQFELNEKTNEKQKK